MRVPASVLQAVNACRTTDPDRAAAAVDHWTDGQVA